MDEFLWPQESFPSTTVRNRLSFLMWCRYRADFYLFLESACRNTSQRIRNFRPKVWKNQWYLHYPFLSLIRSLARVELSYLFKRNATNSSDRVLPARRHFIVSSRFTSPNQRVLFLSIHFEVFLLYPFYFIFRHEVELSESWAKIEPMFCFFWSFCYWPNKQLI